MMKIKNPLPISNIGDPYVLCYEGTYYLYATSHFQGFYCWKSRDLQTWGEASVCYRATEKSFGNGCFWAPEVYEFNGKFYLYYTAQWKLFKEEALRIGVAVSDSPEGPFVETKDQEPMFDFGYGALDAHVLKDGKKNYLYYSRAGADHYVDGARQSEIYGVELGADFLSVVGEGKRLLWPVQEWERKDKERNQYWNEGPFVIKQDGKYHMMYSANCFEARDYGIGGAVSDFPLGPFEKYADNPILSSNATMSGPGHNSVVLAADGTFYCVYHTHTDYRRPGGDRQVRISPMGFENGEIIVFE